MDGSMDETSPFLRRFDGTRLVVKLGDTSCVYSNERDIPRLAPYRLFLPGKSDSQIFCTFSALFDGSVVLSKESNSPPEIFCNGSRIPTGVNINVESGDTIVIGSSEYCYMIDLNDFDEEDGKARCELKSLEDMLSEVLLSGDLSFQLQDVKTGQDVMIDQRLLKDCKGLAMHIKFQHEIIEWIQWFGLSVKSSSSINIIDNFLETKIEISLQNCNVRPLNVKTRKDTTTLQAVTFECLIIQWFVAYNQNQGQNGKSYRLLQKILNYASSSSPTSSFPPSVPSQILEIPKELDPISLMSDLLLPIYNVFQWNDAPNLNSLSSNTLNAKIEDNPNDIDLNVTLNPNQVEGCHDKMNKLSSKPIDDKMKITADIDEDIDSINVDQNSKEDSSLNLKNKKSDLQNLIRPTLSVELSNEIFRFFYLSKENICNDLIANCCNFLIPLCHIGDFKENRLNRISEDFHFRNSLRDILVPYLSFDKEKDDHVTILDVISQTINCIIFLSVKNILIANDQMDEKNANFGKANKVDEVIPFPDIISIAKGFSFFPSISVPPSTSQESAENGSEILHVEDDKIARVKEDLFVDDLKCILRWSITKNNQ